MKNSTISSPLATPNTLGIEAASAITKSINPLPNQVVE